MRKSLEEYRQLAIDILRPSEKELAHGLELHRNSFVFDSYGFMPLGGNDYDFDGNQMTKAGRTEFRWATESYRMNGAFRDPATVERLKEAWEWAGVDCIFQNSGEEGNDIEQLIKRLACYTHVTDMLPELYERVVFPEQLAGLRERGKKALYMTTNGVPLPSKLFSVEDALTYIGVFFKLGIRMMHLTYNRRNLIGDGCSEAANGGLSAFGREVIAEMNRVGVIPDVAHSGLRTSYDAAKCSKKPVVASHTVAGGLSTSGRAKSDEVIQAIKESGGFVGICAHPPFLQNEMNIKTFIDHIDYVARKFGVDHVAIGTDHGYNVGNLVQSEIVFPEYRTIWESLWEGIPHSIKGLQDEYDSMAWVNWPMFTVGLVQRGYSDEEIRKIIGGNVLRVCRESVE